MARSPFIAVDKQRLCQLVGNQGLEPCQRLLGGLALSEGPADGIHRDHTDRHPDELRDRERLVADRATDAQDRAARFERSIDVTIVSPDRRVGRHQARRGPGRLRLRQRSVDQRGPELQLVPSPRIVGDRAC